MKSLNESARRDVIKKSESLICLCVLHKYFLYVGAQCCHCIKNECLIDITQSWYFGKGNFFMLKIGSTSTEDGNIRPAQDTIFTFNLQFQPKFGPRNKNKGFGLSCRQKLRSTHRLNPNLLLIQLTWEKEAPGHCFDSARKEEEIWLNISMRQSWMEQISVCIIESLS